MSNNNLHRVILTVFATVFLLLLEFFWSEAALALDPRKAITQYIHDAWQTKEGLPQNSVQAIVQTRDRYIWLGTKEGLARFDGVRFTVFNKENTKEIKNNNILAFFEDREGDLWIGTDGGLSRLKDGRFKTYTTKEGLSSNVVRSIYGDWEGNLWIGTDGGLNRLKDGKFTVYIKGDLSDNILRSVYKDREGNLWIGTHGGGLRRLKDGRFTTYTTKEGLSSNVVRYIYEDQERNLWIGTDGGLSRLKDGRFTAYTTKEGLSSNSVRSIYKDPEGSLWLGTYGGGLNRLIDGKFTNYTTKEGLSNNFVTFLYKDQEGSLWIGTKGGLNRLKDGKFTAYTTREGLSNDFVRSIYEDRQGSLWVGTDSGGLSRLKDGRFTTYTTKEGLSKDIVLSIYEDRKGNLWIGTNGGGLSRLKDGRFKTYTTKEGLSNNVVRSIYEDWEGNLWMGTDGGLNCLRDGKFTTYTTKEGLSSNVIWSIYGDRAGDLWVSTSDGLSRWKDGKFTTYTTKEGLPNNVVKSIYEDREGTLWLGTSGGGLSRLKDGRFTTYTTKEGLASDVVYQILEDGKGNLWMSYNKGVSRVSKKELTDFAQGRIRSLTSVVYGEADGMKSSECSGGTQPAGWKTRDGRLWFPTMKGAVVVDPDHIKINELPPPVIIEHVVIDNKSIDFGGKIQLPPGSKNFEFHYTALSFLAPEKVKFKYKLEGLDKSWVNAGTRRVAYYTHITPGTYRFKVIACNNDGVWNETGASFSFYLKPYFYQTYLFYALCALAVVLLGTGLYLLRVRQVKARERELVLLVDERTKELQQEIAERKEAEEALRRSEKHFRSLIENASDIITILNSDGVIGYESPSIERMLGYKPEDLVGKSAFEFVHPYDLPKVINTFNHAIQNPGVPLSMELRFQHKDSSWRILEAVGNNLLSDPVVAGVVVNCRDITDRRQAEEALRQSEERLLHAQKMEGIGRLAGGVAHDFNNLLTAIIGYSQLLMESFGYGDPRRKSLEEIKKAGERAASLTRQLLAFSRKQVLEPKVLDLNSVVIDMEKLLRPLIGEDIDLVIVPGAALGQVKADPGQIEQVIMNLAVNARDAMPQGGKLLIETANVELDEAYTSEQVSVIPGRYVMLAVSDNGCGMDAETCSHLFEPFFTTKEQGKGTGLGLATVYGIVRQSGGHIWVYSEPNQGTTFRIYLPRIEEAVERVEPNALMKELARGSETVLLVEDEEALRALAHEVLKRNGYSVLEASNGSEALMICGQYTGPIHVVVTDVVMPGMSGPTLIKHLVPMHPEIKVLYMSGYTDSAIVHQGVLDPGTAFLQKPFTPDVLARKVREVLDALPCTAHDV